MFSEIDSEPKDSDAEEEEKPNFSFEYLDLLTKARKGNKFAMYAVGKLFCDGELVKKDVFNGEMFLKESSRKGFIPADYYLGKMYYLGNDVHKDVGTAEFYLSKAASDDNPYATYLLGRIYSNEKEYLDLPEAVKFFLQSAQSGNSYGYYQVGKIFYYGGNDFQSDISRAMDYLKTAADMGNEYAEQMLYSIQKHKNAVVSNCSLRLLQSLARMMQQRIKDDSLKKQQRGVDRKEQQKINEKKQAHGLRISM